MKKNRKGIKRKLLDTERKTQNSNVHKPCGLYERFFKRWLDILCALVGFIFFWWLYLLLAVMVHIQLGSPVLFTQERSGKDEKVFKLYKFRTMTNARDTEGNFLPDEIRLTKFGKWLRSTSLDELPELFNILKGDMSLIGPRPLLVEYLPYYTEREHRRHRIRPGLTGLAQVSGRNFISWDEIFGYDLEYVDNISFIGDVKIILKTVADVLMRKDIVDMTQAIPDNTGQLHVWVDGKDCISHRPLNVERRIMRAEGDW